MDSLMPILAVVPPTAAFLIFSAVLFLKYGKKKDKTTMYFMLAFLCIGIGYGAWAVRSIFYPADLTGPILFFWHKLAYVFSALIVVFLALGAFEFLKPEFIRKTGNLLLVVTPMIFLEIWMLAAVPDRIITVAGQTDGIWDPVLCSAIGIIALFYFSILNYVFIRFLMENPGHRFYNKVRLMEIGLILLTSHVLHSSNILN